jgi:hypothetical protein
MAPPSTSIQVEYPLARLTGRQYTPQW